jgi:ribosomal-protein-alanine N-acetyltransferase
VRSEPLDLPQILPSGNRFDSRFGNVDCRLVSFDEDLLDAVELVERQAGPYPWSRKNILDSIHGDHHCLALVLSDELCAHAVLSEVLGEVELLILTVGQSHQNLGLGRFFLQQLLRIFSTRCERLLLEVRVNNFGAIRLYQSMGFKKIGLRRNYYSCASASEKEDAIIFECTQLI